MLASLGRRLCGCNLSVIQCCAGDLGNVYNDNCSTVWKKVFLHLCGPPEIINYPKIFHLVLKPGQNMQNPWVTNEPDKAVVGENKAAVWSFTELFSRSAPQITGFLSNTSKRLHSSCYGASKEFLWSEA